MGRNFPFAPCLSKSETIGYKQQSFRAPLFCFDEIRGGQKKYRFKILKSFSSHTPNGEQLVFALVYKKYLLLDSFSLFVIYVL